MRLHVTDTNSHPGIKIVPGWKKFCLHVSLILGMKRVEFHHGMKLNLKENPPLSMKTYNEIYNWYVETSEITFLEK